MKERVMFLNDSFIDYAGKEHNFVIAAISQTLPTRTGQLKHNYSGSENNDRVIYEVNECIDNFGIGDVIGYVTKIVKIGVSICNPIDEFDVKIGERKALSRAYTNKPVLFASHLGAINHNVVQALLEQEAEYIKKNPENYINGYKEMRKSFITRKEMEEMKENFSDTEKQLLENLNENPKFLDKVMKYLNWYNKQEC